MSKKQIIAKLYNLKSQIEGMIGLVDSDVVPPDKCPDAIASIAQKFVADYDASMN